MRSPGPMPPGGRWCLQPEVSVVIPCYNLRDYIIPCVESVLGQECDFPFEVLVADDASSDGSGELLEECARRHGGRLRVLRQPCNRGLVANLQGLLQQAAGHCIAYLDGDDLALPGKLQAQIDYLARHPDCSLCYHEAEVFDSDSGALLRLYSRDFYNAGYIGPVAGLRELVRYGTFLQASSVMFRRHAHMHQAVDPRFRIIVDYPLHLCNVAFGGGSIDRIDRVLGRYRVHAGSFGAMTARSAQRREAVLEELLQACAMAGDLGVAAADVQFGQAHFRFAAALYFLKAGDHARFQHHIALSAQDGVFFDERHRLAFAGREDPQAVQARLFSSAHESPAPAGTAADASRREAPCN